MQKGIVVFCAVVGVAIAAVGLGRPEPKPEEYKNVEGCYVGELNMVIPFGESQPSAKSCMEYSCSEDWVHYVSCGAIRVSPPYKLVTDAEKPYPECCPRAVMDFVLDGTSDQDSVPDK